MQRLPLTHHLRQRQRGVALFVVIVLVMLSMLLALWASRTSLFNELLVGNDADYQRAFDAAQALLQDAELDIRGENADGSGCSGSGDVCRTSTIDKIPLEATGPDGVAALLNTLKSQTPTQCRNGLCAKRTGKQDFWNNADASKGPTLAQMKAAGARYGQFTGAAIGDADAPANPILAYRSDPKEPEEMRGGWYWIEVLNYTNAEGEGLIVDAPAGALRLRLSPNVVYRITALAYGQRSTTMVVLQQTYVRKKTGD